MVQQGSYHSTSQSAIKQQISWFFLHLSNALIGMVSQNVVFNFLENE